MAESFTRITLLVPGPETLRAVTSSDPAIELEWIDSDGAFGDAFSLGTVEPAHVAMIAAAPGAMLVLASVDLRTHREAIVDVVRTLREAGALAVRLEQSKLGWHIDHWLEMLASESPAAWHRACVTFLRADDGAMQSCGMHAFSLPDVRIADLESSAAVQLGTVFDLYQLVEQPPLQSGQTFAPDADTPRRRVERWPDTEYPSGHACWNPYGVWRMGPPGSTARPTGELVPVFIPPLRAILEAAGDLTEPQVIALRDASNCMMMAPRDAIALEQARGYADLDPELVWEQWLLV